MAYFLSVTFFYMLSNISTLGQVGSLLQVFKFLQNLKIDLNPLPPAITSGGNFVQAMLNRCFSATAA